MSGINLAILWTECFNKHDNLDILSFNRKNNSWLKIIFLKTLQFLYFRTRYKQFSIQGEPKNVWSNEQYIGSILLKFWRSLYQSIDPTDLNEIGWNYPWLLFCFPLSLSFQIWPEKSFADFFVVPCYFPKKIQKHCKNTMHDNISLKKFLSEDKIFKTFLTYPAVY